MKRWRGECIVNIIIDGEKVEQVASFKYLESIITEDGRSLNDVNARIALAKDAFSKRKEFLTKSLSKELKKRIVKVLVWPVVMYGCETRKLRKAKIYKLQALEMWI